MQASLSLSELAHLMQMSPPQESPMALWRFALRSVGAGDALFRQGDRFRSMYVVRTGFFRSGFIRTANEYVVGFPMPGDALGMDGVGRDEHPVETVALTDAQVAVVPYALLKQMEWLHGAPCEILVRLLCRENGCKADLLSLLGYRNSTQRAAAFLLHQGERFGRIGYSRTSYPLPMRHADIGSYLHLRPETLSRAFAALSHSGLVEVSTKCVVIRDAPGLQAFAEGACGEDDFEPHARGGRGGRRAARAAHQTRARRAGAAPARQDQQASRQGNGHQPTHRRSPSPQHPAEDAGPQPARARRVAPPRTEGREGVAPRARSRWPRLRRTTYAARLRIRANLQGRGIPGHCAYRLPLAKGDSVCKRRSAWPNWPNSCR